MIDREISVKAGDEFVFPSSKITLSLLHLPTFIYVVWAIIFSVILAILFSMNNILIGLVIFCIPLILVFVLPTFLAPRRFVIRSQNSMVIYKDSQRLFKNGNPISKLIISKNQLEERFGASRVSFVMHDGECSDRKVFGIYPDNLLNKILVNNNNNVQKPVLNVYYSNGHLQTIQPRFKM
jgi:hypothetical protein